VSKAVLSATDVRYCVSERYQIALAGCQIPDTRFQIANTRGLHMQL